VRADILTIEGTINIESTTGKFSWVKITDADGYEVLQVTYLGPIPEPAFAAALLGLLALAAVRRR